MQLSFLFQHIFHVLFRYKMHKEDIASESRDSSLVFYEICLAFRKGHHDGQGHSSVCQMVLKIENMANTSVLFKFFF